MGLSYVAACGASTMVASCAVQCVAGVPETCQTRVCQACDCTPSLCTHLNRRPHDLHKSGQAVAFHFPNSSPTLTSQLCTACHRSPHLEVLPTMNVHSGQQPSNWAGSCLQMHFSICSATQLWLCSCNHNPATKHRSRCGDNSVQ